MKHATVPTMLRARRSLLQSLLATLALPAFAAGPREIEWMELLPEAERNGAAEGPDRLNHDYLNESGPVAKQVGSAAVNAELNNARIRMPGFVVPLTVTSNGLLGEFLLVPYMGACIHLPPPPPNQIVYVQFPQGFDLKSLYDPVWVTGVMTAATRTTRVAAASYTLKADGVEKYDF